MYMGAGPTASSLNNAILQLLPGEAEDPDSTMIAFGNADLTDSVEVRVLARTTGTTDVRVIMVTTNNEVLANVAYRKVSTITNTYKLNLSTISTDTASITPVDSLTKETLKWATIAAYHSTLQLFAHEEEPREPGGCQTCINHDMVCSPSFVNRVRVFALCYGTTWVDLRNCCRKHDIQYWCATNYLEKLFADENVAACFRYTVKEHIENLVPWYCGGKFVGALLGDIQGAIIQQLTRLVLLAIHPGDGRIGGGAEANSCLCDGTAATLNCFTGEMLCEGTLPYLSLGGPSGCACNSSNYFQYAITPHVPGATYSWSVIGGGSVSFTGTDGTATIYATADATVKVTVTLPCGTVTLSKSIVVGKPDKPKFSLPWICRNKTTAILIESPDCVDSWTITTSAGVVIDQIGSKAFFMHVTAFSPSTYSITIVATRCGIQSDPVTVYGFVQNCLVGMNKSLISQETTSDGEQMEIAQIFPNPASSVLQILLPDGRSIQGVKLYNPLGNLVRDLPMAGAQAGFMDVSDLPVGHYMVEIREANGVSTFRKVKLIR